MTTTTFRNLEECNAPDCTIYPTYNHRGCCQGLFCSLHKEPGMVDVYWRNCSQNCNLYPKYGYYGDSSGSFCEKHKGPDMVSIRLKCLNTDCERYPTQNYPGKNIGFWCTSHSPTDTVDVTHRRCHSMGCSTYASFNFEGEKLTLYCFSHKRENMVNITGRRCSSEGCKKFCSFGYTGFRPEKCSEHKEEGMVNVKRKRCHSPECEKVPFFNHSDKKSGWFCFEHKEEGMVNVILSTHVEPKVTTKPRVTQRKICNGCHRELSVKIGYVLCRHGRCTVSPSFNYPGERLGMYCSKHKEDGMVKICIRKPKYRKRVGCSYTEPLKSLGVGDNRDKD